MNGLMELLLLKQLTNQSCNNDSSQVKKLEEKIRLLEREVELLEKMVRLNKVDNGRKLLLNELIDYK